PAFSLLESAQLLAEAIRSFKERCARGIEPNVKRIKQHLDNSLMLVTALNPCMGYEKGRADFAAGLSQGSQHQGCRAQARLSHIRAVQHVGAARGYDAPADGITQRPRGVGAAKCGVSRSSGEARFPFPPPPSKPARQAGLR